MAVHTKLAHLSADQHLEAAILTEQVQDTLNALSRIVARAVFTDDTLRVQKAVQTMLIDRLRTAWDEKTQDFRNNPYQNVGYGVNGRIK